MLARGALRGGALAAVAVAGLWGCREAPPPPAATKALSVFAASSLSEAFTDLSAAFEAEHPEVDLVLALAGSQVLRLQIEQGAAADVFACADARHMQALVATGAAEDPVVFAHNELVVIVPARDPHAITRFDALPDAERIVLGTGAVPIGAYTARMLERADAQLGGGFAARVRARVASLEHNVRLVRAKVELGEADAAIVYRTDAVGAPGVRTVAIPAVINVRADYHLARLARAEGSPLAEAFVAFVRSPAGQRILGERGFVPVRSVHSVQSPGAAP